MVPFGTCQRVLMSIAERIISERKRLGLSQAAFALEAGVSLSSQKRYEKGERDPDSSYLEALERIGVDRFYVVSGTRIDDYASDHFIAMRWLLMEIADVLGLEKGAFLDCIDPLGHLVGCLTGDDDSSTPLDEMTAKLVHETLLTSPFFDGALFDPNLADFSHVLEAVETEQQRLNLIIPPERKARALVILCRSFKASGNLDPVMIEEAVKLAAG